MAESSVTGDSDVIVPYNFEPDGLWSSSSSEESDSDGSQASFTERLGNTSGALARNVCLCRVQLSVPAAGSYQKWRSASKRVVLASQV